MVYVFNLFVSHISTPHYYKCQCSSVQLYFHIYLFLYFLSHVARVTLNIRHDRAPFFFSFFFPLPCGTEIFVMKLIRIVDWSAHNSEAVVHQKHSSQTRCFVVPSRHTPFSYAKKCDLSLPPFIFPSPRPFLLQSELMNAVRCSPLCRVDSFLFFFFTQRY